MKHTFERLFWIDLETTGLDASFDVILEFGLVITDREFKILGGFNTPIYHHVIPRMDPFVDNMHQTSGLTSLITNREGAMPISHVDALLLDHIDVDHRSEDLAVIAGFCPFFDLSFMRRQMPRSASRISHRVFDVHALIYAAELKGFFIDKPQAMHRVMPDINDAIKATRSLMEVL